MKIRIFSIIIVLLVLLGLLTLGASGCFNDGDGAAGDARDDTQIGIETDNTVDGMTEETGNGSEADNVKNDDAQGNGETGGAVSSNAPGAALLDLDGNAIALTDFAGTVVVLNFWASWCPPCRQEMPELNELDKEFKESGNAVFVSVNLTDGQRETIETARQYIEENGFGFTVLIDDQGLLAYEYNVSSIPQTFILDKGGNISGSILGSTTKAAILDKVNAVK